VYLFIDSGNPGCGYPSYDYSSWLGFKTLVFGLRAYEDEYGKARCILQLQPEMVNLIQDTIADYMEKTPDVCYNTGLLL